MGKEGGVRSVKAVIARLGDEVAGELAGEVAFTPLHALQTLCQTALIF